MLVYRLWGHVSILPILSFKLCFFIHDCHPANYPTATLIIILCIKVHTSLD